MTKKPKEIWAKHSKLMSFYLDELGLDNFKLELTAGNLIAIGIREDQIEIIPDDFWIFDWFTRRDGNRAWNKSASYRDVRCVWASDINSKAIDSVELPRPLSRTQALRVEAISKCDEEGLVDLAGGVRSARNRENNINVRTEIYIDYLAKQYPEHSFVFENGEYAHGFSVKSFERAENEYKRTKIKYS